MALILASSSPRRRQILTNLGLEFTVRVPDADETVEASLTPSEAVGAVSLRKARAVAAGAEDIVLAADTMVAVGGRILGKPKDEDDAFRMLSMLSGNVHRVVTGVTLVKGGRTDAFVSETQVEFYTLSEKEIRAYIATGEPMDKAGAYGIQGLGVLLVRRISGDYLGAVGLPAAETVRRIKALEP